MGTEDNRACEIPNPLLRKNLTSEMKGCKEEVCDALNMV